MESVDVDVLVRIFRESPLEDVYVTGYIDNGTAPCSNFLSSRVRKQFHPMWDNVYLLIGSHLLMLSTSDRDPRLKLLLADKIECYFEVDPDDECGAMAVLRTLLQSGRDSARVSRVEVFVDESCVVAQCVVSAMGLEADDGDYLFFDPLTFDGIHVGGRRSRELWIERFGERYRAVSMSVG